MEPSPVIREFLHQAFIVPKLGNFTHSILQSRKGFRCFHVDGSAYVKDRLCQEAGRLMGRRPHFGDAYAVCTTVYCTRGVQMNFERKEKCARAMSRMDARGRGQRIARGISR